MTAPGLQEGHPHPAKLRRVEGEFQRAAAHVADRPGKACRDMLGDLLRRRGACACEGGRSRRAALGRASAVGHCPKPRARAPTMVPIFRRKGRRRPRCRPATQVSRARSLGLSVGGDCVCGGGDPFAAACPYPRSLSGPGRSVPSTDPRGTSVDPGCLARPGRDARRHLEGCARWPARCVRQMAGPPDRFPVAPGVSGMAVPVWRIASCLCPDGKEWSAGAVCGARCAVSGTVRGRAGADRSRFGPLKTSLAAAW